MKRRKFFFLKQLIFVDKCDKRKCYNRIICKYKKIINEIDEIICYELIYNVKFIIMNNNSKCEL